MLDWRRWNKADRTLCCAFFIFLLALAWHLQARGNSWANGFLFCAEAALVGGIADWFAVTALFRKPLGFPYHTALLPRRRDAFVKASVTMVQKEFFSRSKIFHHIERLHLLPMLLSYLAQQQTKEQALHRADHYLRGALLRQDSARQASVLAQGMRASLGGIAPEQVLCACSRWLRESGRDREGLACLSRILRKRAAAPETREAIEKQLEEYEREKTQETAFGSLFSSLAKAVGLVDLEEAAALMQKRLITLAEELGMQDSPLQEQVLGLFYEQVEILRKEQAFQNFLCDLKGTLLDGLPLEAIIEQLLQNMRTQLASPGEVGSPACIPALRPRLQELLSQEYDRLLALMETNGNLHHTVEHFLYDMLARSALHAQTLVGIIVQDVLSRLTDEQLNRLVYDKVEPDLLWIRMNGSIVGAGIGLLLYLLLLLAQSS